MIAREEAIPTGAGFVAQARLLVGWGLISLYTLEKQRQALEAGLHDKTAELVKTNRELEQALGDVTRLSRTDPLTQLWNRRYLAERLQEEIARAERLNGQLSVMLFDPDRFTIINDTYGHPTGDDALRIAASVLRRTARQIDLLSRYGGEEFLILMPATDIEDAHILADRLRANLSCEDFTAPKMAANSISPVALASPNGGRATMPDA